MVDHPLHHRPGEAPPPGQRAHIDAPEQALVLALQPILHGEARGAFEPAGQEQAEEHVRAALGRDAADERRGIGLDRLFVARREGGRGLLQRLEPERAPGLAVGGADGTDFKGRGVHRHVLVRRDGWSWRQPHPRSGGAELERSA